MNPPTITLIQYPGVTAQGTMSPPCGKVHMALRYKGLPYSVLNVQSPMEVKRHNPRGRVPALKIGEEILVDSTDILTELERRHPQPPLEPQDPLERAQVKIWEDWADEVLYFYGVFFRFGVERNFDRMREHMQRTMPIPLRWMIPPIAKRMIRARLKGQGTGLKAEAVVLREYRECLDALSTILGSRPWLAGQNFTRADLSVCAVLDQMRLRQFTPEIADEIEKHAAIVEWSERVHQKAPAAC